ncbi:MAG TPA: beta-N-acetylhexosaminidase [Nitrospiraceae bacterium]|jgi:beta-N-acetylhexosaminidase|nr:beta-N-acetylhexosaminidase [Nitrospiraceae bacterium]
MTADLSLRQKVGQLFMLGFSGTTVSPELADLIKEYQPGGLIHFARNLQNAEQIVELNNAVQRLAGSIPLLISIDQEGGRVSRLPADFTIFPPCAMLGRCGTADLAYTAASVTAAELRAVGMNMNMAPVLDVDSNPQNPIIGDRAFGRSPAEVCTLGQAVMAGLQDHQVIACGKHFPGHGDTIADSHLELPVMSAPRERLQQIELPPFQHAIQHGLATIMTAHVLYPALDPDQPATLSPAILGGLLREQLHFKGVIVTDDLEMRAILDHYGIEDASIRAFQAGADILLICKDRGREVAAMDAMYAAVSDGSIPLSRLDASLQRIRQLKERFLHSFTPADPKTARQIVGSPKHKAVLQTIIHTGEQHQKARV